MNQTIVYLLVLLIASVNGATFIACTASQQSQLNSAAAIAQRYALDATNYLKSHTSNTPRYTTWFGPFTPSRHATVTSHFQRIASGNFAAFTYDCTCAEGQYGYVNPTQFGKIYVCGQYWTAPVTGTDSKAGRLVAMASQFTANGGSQNNVIGQNAAKNLASSDPDQAIFSTDNFEYFSENNPPLQ